MFNTLRTAWKDTDLRKKLLFTIVALVIFRIGSAIPVPFIDSAALSAEFESASVSSSLLGYFNMLSGGAFAQGTLFALSVSPYITAQIIIQLLAVAIPALHKLSESGPEGQEKLNKWNRWLSVGLSFITAYGYCITLANNGYLTDKSWFAYAVIMASFTAGGCITVWMGERIDQRGIGNGISLILFVNIISRLPDTMIYLFEVSKASIQDGSIGDLLSSFFVVIFMIGVIVLVVFISGSERRLPVQYAKRVVGRKMYGGTNTNLPIKINMTGVMPIIFAQSIVSVPATLALLVSGWEEGINTWFSTSSPYPFYALAYLVLIIAFAYFYLTISFDPIEVSNNLKKNGGTILGYRPGKPTADYIRKVLNRVTMIGAIFLGFVAIFPIVFSMFGNTVFQYFALGGSSLLIVVGVALDTQRSLESQITMRYYKGFLD